MFKKMYVAAVAALALAGCQSNQLSAAGQKVMLAPNAPPADCRFIRSISSDKEVNFLSHGFSTNSKGEQEAMNNLKNQAASLGGNYVQMSASQSGVNDDQQQIQVTYTGKVYQCPR
jgi:uncharacterized protein YcfL